MGITMKTQSVSPRRSVVLTKGDWLDVMDQDGVWNVARVLSVPSSEEVEVMYDGWPEEYDEVVRVDSDRVAPYHTFTWAVKCWVKYLNWPLWPSVITIRTPGTIAGIKNLTLENRLYVDFLEDATFANRDRCWQKRRQVQLFDGNFDKNRKETNGAQFELALGSVLQSDATAKMPTFAKGTLPLQYENTTTESVEKMRKLMGSRLWYRNFNNNRERHLKTHKYETMGDEEDEYSSDEAAPVPNLKVRRPITSPPRDDQDSKKKKRPLPAKKQSVAVKIEQEPLAKVGLGSSDDQASGGERSAALTKKRRLRSEGRSAVSPVTRKEMTPTKGKRSSSPEDTNLASSMPRHVTVLMDEIIVDDDEDSGDDDVHRGRVARKPARSPRKQYAESEENDAFLEDEPSRKRKMKTKAPPSGRQRVRQRQTEKVIPHNRKASSGEPTEPAIGRRKDSSLSLSEDNDENMHSDGFDPGSISEVTSPLANSQDSLVSALLAAKSKAVERLKINSDDKATVGDAKVTPHFVKKKGKGQTKMAARRSVPPLQDVSLTASPKRRTLTRSPRSLSDEVDWEDEEKGALRDAAKEVERPDKALKKSVASSQSKHAEDSKQDTDSEAVAAPPKSSKSKPLKHSKPPLSLIEQRIAAAQKELRNLDREKKEAAKATAPKRSSSSSSCSRDGSQPSASRAKKAHSYQPKSLAFSFLRVDDKVSGSSVVPGGQEDRSPMLEFSSSQQGHSFLSVDQRADSSDRPNSSTVGALFDEDTALDFHSDSKETTEEKAEAKSLPEVENAARATEGNGDEKKEDEDEEMSGRVCMMQAGLEGRLDDDEEQSAQPKTMKKTVISVPRKFDEAAPDPTESVPTPSTAVFSSSKGFSMDKWFKRMFTVSDRS
ncbi:hypothetical protein GN244_ATG00900 [Phytophthora infestans]|uniref:PWWP domain-containing protein n=1 Tax=Phytophthora infestans TaxID=4787 RepID=A0A833TTL3_PHYIN|nr:hypothetical protein GN244_ATG00900 [Phytophthora infestans]